MSAPIYLRFNSPEEAFSSLTNNGFICVDEFASAFDKGRAFGVCISVEGKEGYFCNIYNYDGTEYDNVKLPTPNTPYNAVA